VLTTHSGQTPMNANLICLVLLFVFLVDVTVFGVNGQLSSGLGDLLSVRSFSGNVSNTLQQHLGKPHKHKIEEDQGLGRNRGARCGKELIRAHTTMESLDEHHLTRGFMQYPGVCMQSVLTTDAIGSNQRDSCKQTTCTGRGLGQGTTRLFAMSRSRLHYC